MRPPFAALTGAFLAAWAVAAPCAVRAKTAPLTVLVDATVTDQAHATMSQALWTKYVDAYVAAKVVPFDGEAAASLADCRQAHADYVIVAPFDLRPRLPGMPNSSGRVAARTHLSVTNCITGNRVVDQNINFDSDPPSGASDGDFESVPEVTWAHSVPATLAKYPLAFERVARITNLNVPFAFVDLNYTAHLGVGDELRDFATAAHVNRPHPIVLTVTQVFDTYIQVTFSSTSGELPGVGDLVEPVPKASP